MSALDRFANTPVRTVARSPGPAAEELFSLAMGGQKEWTLPEWQRVLAELDACEDTIEDWRILNT